jgi:hypothetical protein
MFDAELAAGGSHVRDLRFESGHAGFVVASSGTVERVYSHTTGAGVACLTSGKVLDSVCWSEAGRGVLAGNGNVLIRNVTTFGGTYGIHAQTSSAGKVSVDVVNTIARGMTKDLFAEGSIDQFSGDLSATIAVRFSNFQTQGVPDSNGNQINEGSGNQLGDPHLVNPAAGDFHETAASPTLDNGEPASGFDLDGDARAVGAGTDIGADEVPIAPAASTLAATDVTLTGGTLQASVDAGGTFTDYRFEFGATPDMPMSTAPATLAPAVGSQGVSARLEGLAQNTTYYFRAVATNSKGTSIGPTVTFTTQRPDTDPPLVGNLRLTRSSFAVGRAFTPLSAAARGTVLSFSSSEAGSASITVQRALPGRRRAGRCVPPRRARRNARRCTRWKGVVTLTRAVQAGRTRVPFSGRVGSRSLSRVLRPGRYRFRVAVKDALGNRAAPAAIRFRVVRG